MDSGSASWPQPLRRMRDGTVKQVNPYSGTSVWTVPRRGNRPVLDRPEPAPPLDPELAGRYCAFCELRYLETPPEKSRLERAGDDWVSRSGLSLAEVLARPAEFRCISNLVEIVSYDYWRLNYGYEADDAARARFAAYVADPAGRDHVLDLAGRRAAAAGESAADWADLTPEQRLATGVAFFAGGHDVVVARRHVVDGSNGPGQLASAGALSVDDHRHYVAFTVEALRELYETNPNVRYVAVFQNWLRGAGASFDHLHKQLVAIDERSSRMEVELSRVRANPDFYNEAALGYAAGQGLVVAENAEAIAYAGFGHRYPSIEVFSKAPSGRPWRQTPDQVDAMADLLHACHAATGAEVASNEEWHHRWPDLDLALPWRIVLKWRLSTLAGFEGGTKIYLNTIDPWQLRDRVVDRLSGLRESGALAPGIAVGEECPARPNTLRYRDGRE